MQVLTSGQAGLFAIQTAKGFLIERLDTGEAHETDSRRLSYYLSGCNDVQQLSVRDIREARVATQLAWSADRAVRLFIMLLDTQEMPEDLIEVGEVLDDLLAVKEVDKRVEFQLFSAPLPQPIEVNSILYALKDAPRSKALFERFLDHQLYIARVRTAFDAIDNNLFENSKDRSIFLEEAIDRGCVRELVLAAASEKGIESVLFELYSQLKKFENYREVIKSWTDSFKRTQYNLDPQEVPEVANGEWSEPAGSGGRQAFEKVLAQQAVIIERIRNAEFETARRYTKELVDYQRVTGSAEHIAMTLDKLSQKAKKLDVPELAIEWALAAVEAKGDDPKTHAQLADLLIKEGRYTEAQHSLDLAQSYGEAGFAAAGRARILRYKGQYDEALAAHRAELKHYGTDHDGAQYNLAGIAECLRDMELFKEALAAYDDALKHFPYSAVLHAGRASTLADLGQFDDAIRGYQNSISLDDDNAIPRNGIATLYRLWGDFSRAERELRAIIVDYPFNVSARSSLIATLRDAGRFDEAVQEALILVDKLPSSADAHWALADAQIDAGKIEDATRTLNSALEGFRSTAGLHSGLARIERAKGNYAGALKIYDDVARKFPSNFWILVSRADMLRRLGHEDEALHIYESASKRHPQRLSFQNAIASIYIHQKRYDDARKLLVVSDPKSTDEWRNLALCGMLESALENEVDATKHFEFGISHCPFLRERNMFRAGLARMLLKTGETVRALTVTQECKDDVSELIRFHAVAAQDDYAKALASFQRLQHRGTPEPYIELRDQIAANYNVIAFPIVRSPQWILQREAEMLLLEAA